MKKKEFVVADNNGIYDVIDLYASYWEGALDIEDNGDIIMYVDEDGGDTYTSYLGRMISSFETFDEAYDCAKLYREMEED